ncbi:hypothetical protein [Herbaspirillum sp. SJZ107]|uniref:hypothetical protein n=1 Tax=Herbaspirillum sp. SJZ107 TaxID=2572881 RepID=UPI0011518C71|nr:hypothetical protein [Herbaspirillum sp. SJZ107]TQK11558.1 hypothetical protein FBX97_1507 [Herbaspirillum sp. SJZ107]
MSSTNNTTPGASHTSSDGQSVTIGVGNPTSGEEGATLTHETMQETGGSGGDALTKPRDLETAPPAPVSSEAAQREQASATAAPEGAGSDATAIARGYQDTRSGQAGRGETGLGTPETGGNQDESDLPPPRKN